MCSEASARTIAGMRILVAAAAVLVFAACGQHTDGDAVRGSADALGTASPGTSLDALPPECEGDADHCVVLTRYAGVNVYKNVGAGGFCATDGRCALPNNDFGTKWQCVELFNRFFWKRFGTEPVLADARDLLVKARGVDGLEVHPHGGAYRPVAGDALVFTDDDAGHVAIVVGVDDQSVHVVEQNSPGDGTNRYRYDPVTNRLLSASSRTARSLGWIHASANRAGDSDRALSVHTLR